MKFVVWFFICTVFIDRFGYGARILGVVPTPSYSHQIVFWPLWKELSLRGHQVTVITTDPINNSELVNLTEINIGSAYKVWGNLNMFELFDKPMWNFMFQYFDLSETLINEILSNPNVKNLIKDETAHFDLVMIEAFHMATLGFAPRFKCPTILITSLDASSFAYNEIGNPAHPVLHPDFMLPFKYNLTFFERLASWFNSLSLKIIYLLFYIPSQQQLITKHFGDQYPHIRDIYNNYSLLFINTNTLVHSIRPLLPNIIQIGGGTHLLNYNPLPEKLQNMLDNAEDGFIYFSLGSNVKSKHLTNNTKEEILNTFKELPYTVLWKFEDTNFPNLPKNVLISKWFPQQDIFQHPNIKLFITQGGLQSLEEAIFNHIPIIGIPVMADQMGNIASIVSKGLGLSLDYKNITKDVFKKSILEIINNPSYRINMKKMAEHIKDQPETGLERAIWWTEYVIRHKGAPYLRNPGLDLPWYQYYLLDIIGFLLMCILIIFYALRLFLKISFKICSYIKKNSKTKKKQN